MIEPGLKHTSTAVVTEALSARVMGSGDLPVYATPAMTALMENAAMLAVAGELPEGSTTVGGRIEVSHMAPTPIGATITATATLEKVDGRKLHFSVIAMQGDTVIGEGTHLRFVVDRERFMSKL